MKSKSFYCNRCHKFFNTPKIYCEKHGLDFPPYERVAVCPFCNCDDIARHNATIEKNEVVEKILPAVMYLNKHIYELKDIFGSGIKNENLFFGVEMIEEMIFEMFDFLDVPLQKKILKMKTEKELEEILIGLRCTL